MSSYFSDILQALDGYGQAWQTYFEVHHTWMVTVVFSSFTFVNTVRIIAYVPQIFKAARDRNGATAISYLTWSLFLISHLTTIAYVIVCNGDLIMAIIFLGNAIACCIIIAITFLTRRRHKQRLRVELPSMPLDLRGQ